MFAYTLSGDNSENLILYETENNATMDFLLDGENGSSSRESIANLLDEGLGTSLDGTDDMSCSIQTTAGRTDSGVFSGDETPSPPTQPSQCSSQPTRNSESGVEHMDSQPSPHPTIPSTPANGKSKVRSKNTSPSRQGPQRCLVCGKVFSNASALTKHKLTHSDERKHACSICGKAFKRQDHLNGHMLTHRNKKPFECRAKGCGKSYCDGRSLRRHIESRHGVEALATLSIQPTPPLPGAPLSTSSSSSSQGSSEGAQSLSGPSSTLPSSSTSSPSSGGGGGDRRSASSSISPTANINVTRLVTNSNGGKNIICNYVNALDGSPIAGMCASVGGERSVERGGGDERLEVMMRDKNKCSSAVKMEVVDIISCPTAGSSASGGSNHPPAPIPPPPLLPGNEPVIHQDDVKPLDIKLALTPVNVPEHAPSSHPPTPSSHQLPSATLKLIEPIHFTEAGGKLVGLTLSTANGLPALCSLVSGSKLMGPLTMTSSPSGFLNGGAGGTTITTNTLPITIRATQSQLQQLLSQRTPIGSLLSSDGVNNNAPLVSFTPISFINGKTLANLPNNSPVQTPTQINSEVTTNPGSLLASGENKGSGASSRVDIMTGNNTSTSSISVNARGGVAARLSSSPSSLSSNTASGSPIPTATLSSGPGLNSPKTSPTLLEEQIELIHQIIQQAQEESNLAAAANSTSTHPTGKSSKGTSKKSSKATPHANPLKLESGEELMKTPCPEKPVECTICCRRFKNTPALNGHMRLHGGYFKKDSDGRKRDIVVANNKESSTTPLQTVSVSVRALIEEKINQKRSSQIQGGKPLDRRTVPNNIVAQAVNAPTPSPTSSPSHKGVEQSFTVLAGTDGGSSSMADNSPTSTAPPPPSPNTSHLSQNSEEIVNFGSTFTTSANLNSQNVEGGATTLQFVCGDENSDYLLMEEEVFNKVSSICPDSFLSGLDESILNSAHDTIPPEWQWAVTSIGLDLGNCRQGNSLFFSADNSPGEDASSGGGKILEEGGNVDSSFTSISSNGSVNAGSQDSGKPSAFPSATGPHSPSLNSQDSPSFIYPTPPASLESHNALQSPLFPFPSVSISAPPAPLSAPPAQHPSPPSSILFSSSLDPTSSSPPPPSLSLLCSEMNTNIIIGNSLSDPPSISDDMDFAQATSDFNQILNDSLCVGGSSPRRESNPPHSHSLESVNELLRPQPPPPPDVEPGSDLVSDMLIKVEHEPTSGLRQSQGAKAEACLNPEANLPSKLQSPHPFTSFPPNQINFLQTDSSTFQRSTITPSECTNPPGRLSPHPHPRPPTLQPVHHLKINEPSPMNYLDSNNHVDIFLGPPRIPQPLSPVKRKQVRNTFASNLRPESVPAPTSPPPPQPHNHFTPYPILSPVRSASGLYWTFASKLAHVDDSKKQLPRINLGSNFQAQIPDYSSPPPNKSPRRQSCQTQLHPSHDRPLWLPYVVDNALLDEVENFLEFACCSAIPGGGRNKEYALHVLNHTKGNIMAAMAILMKPNPSLPENMKDYKYEEKEKWTREEMFRFQEALLKHGKDFLQVAQEIGKSVEECVIFYYLWKKVCPLQYERVRDVWKKRDSIFTLELLKTVPPPGELPAPPPSLPPQTSPTTTPSPHHNNNHQLPNNNNNPTLPSSQQSNPQEAMLERHPLSPQPLSPEYPCKVCGKIFSKVKSRSAHMKSHRPPEPAGESHSNNNNSRSTLSSGNKKSNTKLNTAIPKMLLTTKILRDGNGTLETTRLFPSLQEEPQQSQITATSQLPPKTLYCGSGNSLLLSVSPFSANSPPGGDVNSTSTDLLTTSSCLQSISSPSFVDNVPSKDFKQDPPSSLPPPPPPQSSHDSPAPKALRKDSSVPSGSQVQAPTLSSPPPPTSNVEDDDNT